MVDISLRLRDALVADLVEGAVEDDDPEEVDWLTTRLRFKEDSDVTDHLGRQLGFRTDLPGGIHATLTTLVPELDRLVNPDSSRVRG